MPLVCVRTNMCKLFAGGVAAVWTALLRQLLLVEKISTSGIPVSFGPGEDAVLFFRVGIFCWTGTPYARCTGPRVGVRSCHASVA